MVTLDDLRVRVAGGAAWLDATSPGWVDKITGTLEMSECRMCILGQLFGNFWRVVDVRTSHHRTDPLIQQWAADYGGDKEYTMEWARRRGFVLTSAEIRKSERDAAYDLLGQAWLEVIERRKQFVGVSGRSSKPEPVTETMGV